MQTEFALAVTFVFRGGSIELISPGRVAGGTSKNKSPPVIDRGLNETPWAK
jgi:hypothetical protein